MAGTALFGLASKYNLDDPQERDKAQREVAREWFDKKEAIEKELKKKVATKEYNKRWGHGDYKDYKDEYNLDDPLVKEMVDLDIEHQRSQPGQRVRDISMSTRYGGDIRPIWNKIMEMRGEMMESEKLKKLEKYDVKEFDKNLLNEDIQGYAVLQSGNYSEGISDEFISKYEGDKLFHQTLKDTQHIRRDIMMDELRSLRDGMLEFNKDTEEVEIGDIEYFTDYAPKIYEGGVEGDYEDIDPSDDGTPQYAITQTAETYYDISSRLPYYIKVETIYETHHQYVKNEETGEWEHDENDQDAEDYYPEKRYYLVRKADHRGLYKYFHNN